MFFLVEKARASYLVLLAGDHRCQRVARRFARSGFRQFLHDVHLLEAGQSTHVSSHKLHHFLLYFFLFVIHTLIGNRNSDFEQPRGCIVWTESHKDKITTQRVFALLMLLSNTWIWFELLLPDLSTQSPTGTCPLSLSGFATTAASTMSSWSDTACNTQTAHRVHPPNFCPKHSKFKKSFLSGSFLLTSSSWPDDSRFPATLMTSSTRVITAMFPCSSRNPPSIES